MYYIMHKQEEQRQRRAGIDEEERRIYRQHDVARYHRGWIKVFEDAMEFVRDGPKSYFRFDLLDGPEEQMWASLAANGRW
jgi:hypothetical protein